MPRRIAAVMALTVFTLCLLVGVVQAENGFVTAVTRALVAMAGAFVVGMVVGTMGQKMIDENVLTEERKLRKVEESQGSDR